MQTIATSGDRPSSSSPENWRKTGEYINYLQTATLIRGSGKELSSNSRSAQVNQEVQGGFTLFLYFVNTTDVFSECYQTGRAFHIAEHYLHCTGSNSGMIQDNKDLVQRLLFLCSRKFRRDDQFCYVCPSVRSSVRM